MASLESVETPGFQGPPSLGLNPSPGLHWTSQIPLLCGPAGAAAASQRPAPTTSFALEPPTDWRTVVEILKSRNDQVPTPISMLRASRKSSMLSPTVLIPPREILNLTPLPSSGPWAESGPASIAVSKRSVAGDRGTVDGRLR